VVWEEPFERVYAKAREASKHVLRLVDAPGVDNNNLDALFARP
jgi:hypothetical protein